MTAAGGGPTRSSGSGLRRICTTRSPKAPAPAQSQALPLTKVTSPGPTPNAAGASAYTPGAGL